MREIGLNMWYRFFVSPPTVTSKVTTRALSTLDNWQLPVLLSTSHTHKPVEFNLERIENWFKNYTRGSRSPDMLKADRHKISEMAWMPTSVGGICWLRMRITRSVQSDAPLWLVAIVPAFSLANACFSAVWWWLLLLARRWPVGFIGESSDCFIEFYKCSL